MSNVKREYEFNYKKIFTLIKQNSIWLLLSLIVFSSLSALFTAFLIDKTYSTTVKFYVYSDADSSSGSITSSQLSAADTHAYSAMEILSTKECQSAMGVEDKEVDITSSKKSNSPIFTVSVSGVDRFKVCEIAENIKNTLPEYVYSITKIGNLTSFGFTGVDNIPDSPNIVLNSILSGFFGFILAFVAVFLKSILDTGIHAESDVKNHFDYPILGSIPIMPDNEAERTHISHKRKSRSK